MNKEKIIKDSKKFTEIIDKQINLKSKYFSIYYEKTINNNKYGITIPKKIGKANIRNKIKRQLKNIIITNEKTIQSGYNYVIIIKKPILKLKYLDMKEELLELIKKVRD